MLNIDLEQMLNEIIETYGKNDGYTVPTISWSKENMIENLQKTIAVI